MAFEKLQYALDTDDKNVRDERIGEITDEIIPALEEQFPDNKRANRRNSLQNAKGNRSCMACSGQTC